MIGFGLTVAAAMSQNYLISFSTLLIALLAFAPDLVRTDAWMKKRNWSKIKRFSTLIAMLVVPVIVFLVIVYFIGKKTGWWLF